MSIDKLPAVQADPRLPVNQEVINSFALEILWPTVGDLCGWDFFAEARQGAQIMHWQKIVGQDPEEQSRVTVGAMCDKVEVLDDGVERVLSATVKCETRIPEMTKALLVFAGCLGGEYVEEPDEEDERDGLSAWRIVEYFFETASDTTVLQEKEVFHALLDIDGEPVWDDSSLTGENGAHDQLADGPSDEEIAQLDDGLSAELSTEDLNFIVDGIISMRRA